MNKITHIFSKIVGSTFNGSQERIKELDKGDILELVREPENKYDKNAIAIYSNGILIGYVRATLAISLAPAIDEGYKYKCIVEEITGKTKPFAGCNIKITKLDEVTDIQRSIEALCDEMRDEVQE